MVSVPPRFPTPQVFGDIRHIYSACKHRGFIMVTYFDLRSAIRAQTTLNGTVLCGVPLEVHFSAPKGDSSASNQVRARPGGGVCGR